MRLIQTRANDYDQESSAIKMGFLQILAQMPPTNMESVGAAKTLNSLWQNDQDAGVHSSTKLLAKRLGISLHPLEVGQKGNWLVDQFEQEFAIVGSEGELGIHDIDKALPLTIPWLRHTRKFRHKFAIAMNELSIEQFRKYFPAYQADNSLLQESAGDAAMVHCTLQAAYQFCNALSVQANLPTCYELSEDDDSYLVPKPQHLKLTGYRLPTDGEWELACRAGSTTARYFGNADHLTDQYGWVGDNFSRAAIENHMVLPQTTAALLPNRWGLFDCYGNALEMCDESLDPEPVGCTYDDITCLPAFPRHMSPVIRGSSIMYPKEYAQSHCRSKQLVGLENTWFGFRLARTLPE